MNKKHILHTADWHLRENHLGLSVRGPDFFKAALSTITHAANLQRTTGEPTCMLVPGDILNSTRPSSASIEQLRKLNTYAIDNKIKIFTVIGNHDQTSPAWSEVLAKDEKYGFDDITGKTHVIWEGLKISGIYPVPSHELPAALSGISGTDNVVMWHGSLKDFTGYPVENMLAVEDLELAHCQLFLLGDIHKTEYIRHRSGCLVGYPGATELCSRKEPLTHTCTHFVFDELGKVVPSATSYLPVDHRPAMAFRIDTEEDLTEVITKVKAAQDTLPIVLIRYNPELPNVGKLLRQSIDVNKVILRDEASPSRESSADLSWALLNMHVEKSKAQDISLNQLMTDVIGKESTILPVCHELTNPGINVAIALTAFVDRRLAEIV